MIAPRKVYTNQPTDPLAEFRGLIARYPDKIYGDSRELALLLRCSESEVEEAQRWVIEDGLEVVA